MYTIMYPDLYAYTFTSLTGIPSRQLTFAPTIAGTFESMMIFRTSLSVGYVFSFPEWYTFNKKCKKRPIPPMGLVYYLHLQELAGGFKHFFFSSLFGEDEPILITKYLSNGLVQPPSRKSLHR